MQETTKEQCRTGNVHQRDHEHVAFHTVDADAHASQKPTRRMITDKLMSTSYAGAHTHTQNLESTAYL